MVVAKCLMFPSVREEDANAEVPCELDTFNSAMRNIICIVVKHGKRGEILNIQTKNS